MAKKQPLKERFQQLAGIKPLYEKGGSDYNMLRSFQRDELLDDLGDLISKYVKDPDDVNRELDNFDDGGFDNMSDLVTSNLSDDDEYQEWEKKFKNVGGEEDLTFDPEDGYVDEVELKDLDFETLKAAFPKFYQKVKFTRPQTGEPYYEDAISFPNLDDSSMVIGDKLALEDWKDKVLRRFGNVEMVFNDEEKNSFDRVFVSDDAFNDERDEFIRGKMSAMQKDMDKGRSID